jgi:hypothetical protein
MSTGQPVQVPWLRDSWYQAAWSAAARARRILERLINAEAHGAESQSK